MFLANLPEPFLRTILHQIALLLLAGAGGDMEAARHAAAATLSAYAPRTEVELRPAARTARRTRISVQDRSASAWCSKPTTMSSA
jgi:hypothetical protein